MLCLYNPHGANPIQPRGLALQLRGSAPTLKSNHLQEHTEISRLQMEELAQDTNQLSRTHNVTWTQNKLSQYDVKWSTGCPLRTTQLVRWSDIPGSNMAFDLSSDTVFQYVYTILKMPLRIFFASLWLKFHISFGVINVFLSLHKHKLKMFC